MKHTPLYESHVRAGARMVPFAGWEMPVQYTGVIEEVRATRERAGLFDVSHMGEFLIEGPGALAWLNGLTTNDVARLTPGRAQYSLLCLETGGIRDDILLYRLDDERYLMVVNAGNTAADWEWLSRHRVAGVGLADVSKEFSLIAVQGPGAIGLLQPLASTELSPVRRFGFVEGEVAGVPCLISRTGYTGEDGFELFTRADPAGLWQALVTAGSTTGNGGLKAQPCGLGARDVLRLEAGNVLYGHEIGEDVNPLAAGLSWVIKLDKGPFIGADAIRAVRDTGPAYRLAGLTMRSRAIPRQGYSVLHEDEAVGEVTSGTFSPTLERPIGLAFVPAHLAAPDTSLAVEVRGRPEPAVVTALPFYKGR
jgi:aminomethyltransferase